MSARYVLEGEWTGYVERQRRVVHREVITAPTRIERLRNLHAILYTDGTSLILRLREAEHREQVKEIRGYTDLIRECEAQPGAVVSVANLPSIRRAS